MGYFFLALAFVIWAIGTSSFPSSSEVTVYPVSCRRVNQSSQLEFPKFVNGECIDGFLAPLNRSRFRVTVEKQEVHHWFPYPGGAPTVLKDCEVWDKLNWGCRYSDKSTGMLMINGELFEWPDRNDTLYVSGWYYWYLKYWPRSREISGKSRQ